MWDTDQEYEEWDWQPIDDIEHFSNLTDADRRNCRLYHRRYYLQGYCYGASETNDLVSNLKGDNKSNDHRNGAIKQFAFELDEYIGCDGSPTFWIPMPSANSKDDRLVKVIGEMKSHAILFDVLRYRYPRQSQYKHGPSPTRQELEDSLSINITQEAFKTALEWSYLDIQPVLLDDGIQSGLQFSVARQKLAEYGIEIKEGYFWYRVV